MQIEKEKDPEYVRRGKLASQTRIKNKKKLSEKRVKKNYNSPKKNDFRDKVVSRFARTGNTLALETEQYLFVDKLPQCEFYIYETDPETFQRAVQAKRSNVKELVNKNVGEAQYSNQIFDQAFLDFMCSFDSAMKTITLLKKKLDSCNVIAITYSIRTGQKRQTQQDQVIEAQQCLAAILPDHKLLTADTYADGNPMRGIILERDPKLPKKMYSGKGSMFEQIMDNARDFVLYESKSNAIKKQKEAVEKAREALDKLPMKNTRINHIVKVIFEDSNGKQIIIPDARVWEINFSGSLAFQIRGDNLEVISNELAKGKC